MPWLGPVRVRLEFEAAIVASIALLTCVGSIGCDQDHAQTDPQTKPLPSKPEPLAAAAEPEPSAVPPPLPPVGAYVVIEAGSSLFAGPDLDAPRFAPAPDQGWSGPGRPSPAPVPGWVAEVVGVDGGRIELRTLADPGRLCAPGFGAEPRFALHFFADPSALHPVLIRAQTLSFADGSSLALAPGVPVSGSGDDALAHVHGLRLRVSLDPAAVGLAYTPTPAGDRAAQPSPTWAPKGSLGYWLGYGERRLSPEDPAFTAPPLLAPVAVETIAGTTLLHFAGGCGRLTLRETDEPVPVRDDPYGLAFHARPAPERLDPLDPAALAQAWGCALERWIVPAGTPVEWRVGGTAGVASVEHAIPFRPADERGRVCFEAGNLHLCAAATELEHAGDPGCVTGGRGLQIHAGAAPGSNVGPSPSSTWIELRGWSDPDITRRLLETHVEAFQACYREALGRRPTLAGVLVLALVIDGAGRVGRAQIEASELGRDPDLSACLTKAARRGRFSKPDVGETGRVWAPLVLTHAATDE